MLLLWISLINHNHLIIIIIRFILIKIIHKLIIAIITAILIQMIHPKKSTN